jgi:hypothetical protein
LLAILITMQTGMMQGASPNGAHPGHLTTVVGDNEIGEVKNEGKLLAILIAMAMQW